MAKTSIVIKKKRWVQIVAPQEFGNAVIGETYVVEAQDAVNRTLSVSLMTLTGEPSTQSQHAEFRITGVQNNALSTEVTGFNIITSAVRKMMRRGKEKIEDSFVVSTKDGKNIRVKPILVTKNRAKGGVLADLQKKMRNSILKLVGEMTYSEFVSNLMAHKFQRQLMDSLRKVYPLSVCEIRWMSVEQSGVPIKEVATRPEPVEEEPVAETAQA